MKAKLRDILQKAESWPPSVQDEALEYLLAIGAECQEAVVLTDDARAVLARSAEGLRPGGLASDEEVRGLLRRYRDG